MRMAHVVTRRPAFTPLAEHATIAADGDRSDRRSAENAQ